MACLGNRADATQDEVASKIGKVGVLEPWMPLCLTAWPCGVWAACLTVQPVGTQVSPTKACVSPEEYTPQGRTPDTKLHKTSLLFK